MKLPSFTDWDMYFPILLLTTALAVGGVQNESDMSEIFAIFPQSTVSLETTTTEHSSIIEQDDELCKCVPHYLCRGEYVAHIFDRYAPSCTSSVEVCCTELLDPSTRPKPDPSKVQGCGYRNPQGVRTSGVQIPGNGKMVEFGEFPWVVAILNAKNESYFGAGVLIHRQVVMTTAHIAVKYEALKIRAGEWDTQTTKELYDFQERNVDEIHIHKDYNRKTLNHDVALLRLSEPLELTEHINVICLPEQDEDFSSFKSCVANGWGRDSFGKEDRFAVILRKVEIDMMAHDRCQTLLRNTRLTTRFNLHSSFVCAGGEGEDNCIADGGAPLVCPIGNNRYKLAGLTAWSVGCGMPNVPAAYANVATFRNWVDDKMAEWGVESTGNKITNNTTV